MRQPINVLVIPFYIKSNNPLYVVFKRSDGNVYQFIAGGLEDNESALDAARRESFEEANILESNNYLKLDATASIPASVFVNETWGDVYVVQEISYGVKLDEMTLILSHEHDAYEWLTYEEAYKKLTFDSNKVALYELNERLKRGLFVE